MSSIKRIGSGTIASWCRLFVNLTTQIVLVPIFIRSWSIEVYGIWLTAMTIVSMLQIADLGYQSYIESDLLQFRTTELTELGQSISNALFGGALLGGVQFVATIGLVVLAGNSVINESDSGIIASITATSGVLLLHSLAWWIFGSAGGTLIRGVAAFGKAPRMAWWGVGVAICSTVSSLLSVVLGGGIVITGYAFVFGFYSVYLLALLDARRLLQMKGVRFPRPKCFETLHGIASSFILTIGLAMDNLRQQGIRVIITEVIGPTALANFSITRTIPNLMIQSLSSVSTPLLPELARFLRCKQSELVESCFGIIWILFVSVVAPTSVLLQFVAPDIFNEWVNRKVDFDPVLFGMFSSSVLVSCACIPLYATMKSLNLIKMQLLTSLIAAVIGIGLLFPFAYLYGNRGAALSLLAADISILVSSSITVRFWMNANQIRWPSKAFSIVLASSSASIALIFLAGSFPHHLLAIGVASVLFGFVLSCSYWFTLPEYARCKTKAMMAIRYRSS